MAEKVIWSDLHPDLKVNARGQITVVTNVEAVYASVNNIMFTIIGERVMLRRFAMNFRSMLFEPIVDEVLRGQFVTKFKEAIQTWEPRVIIEYLDFTPDPDNQTVRIRMEMYIRGYANIFSFDKVYEI